MSTLMRTPTTPLRPWPAALVVLSLILAACATAGPATTTAPPTGGVGSPAAGSPSSEIPSASPSVSLTPVPGGPTPTPTAPSESPVSTTSTAWGVIQDALPRSFPVYPGSHEAQPDEAASGAFSVPADGETTTSWYQAALETAGFTTQALSGPFEDGRTVIDSVGEAAGCKVQTTIQPLSGTTLVTVLYGAGCPSR
jgi:hypothetical protein